MKKLKRLITEIHRRSLWQVLGIYAVSAWVVYQVVLGLYEGIGLPDWVPATAVVLLLVGLPIVLATAFVQEGTQPLRPERAVEPAQATGAAQGAAEGAAPSAADAATAASEGPETGSRRPQAPSPRPRAFFTWPRAVTGGVLAFALLGIAASGFMGMRALGIGPAATLVSAGVLEAREPILLADLGSPSGDSVIASAITAALRVDLESSPAVSVVQTTRVQEALRRMRREASAPIDEALATEIALREGIRAVLVGEVTAAGGQYVLTARLVTPEGDALASVRETASPDAVIEAADRLSASLRERLGESLKSIRSGEPLAQVTTPSLEALRKYSQGLRAHDSEPDARKAVALLEEAVALDSAFAMAWRKLGVAYQYIDRDSMRAALEQAYRHRDRLTDRERYLTEGTYYDVVRSDTARAMTAYETLLDLYPEEPTALHNLGRLYGMRGDRERASELYARKIRIDPYGAVTIRNQAHILAQLKRYDALDSLLTLYGERYPEHYQAPQFTGALAAIRGDYAAALEHFDRAYELSEGDVGPWSRASVLRVQGRHAEAAALMRENMRDATPEERGLSETMNTALLEVTHRQRPDQAIRAMADYFTEERLAALAPERRPYFELTVLNVVAGATDVAERWLARWREAVPSEFDPMGDRATDATLEVAAARGDVAPAIERYRRDAEDDCLDCWYHLGRMFEAAGMPDSAIVAYETYIDPPHPPLFRVNTDHLWLPPTLQRLAELHEQAGNREAAAHHYARLVDLWKDADADFQPRVDAARRALARLTDEGS